MSDALHPAAPDDLGGLSLARYVSRLGVDSSQPCTFLLGEGETLGLAWKSWLATWFRPVLAPAFVAVHGHASASRPLEIVPHDLALDRALDEPTRRRSLAVGRSFLEGKAMMRAHREWSGFAERVAAGEAPGHAATLFALQSALYHLPLANALAAYAWFELESGLPRGGWRDEAGGGAEALEAFSVALPELRLAITGEAGQFEDDGPRLRAV
jgi:hypothetical protein